MGLRPRVPRSAGREAAASRVDVVTVLLFFGCAVLAAGNFVAVPFSNRELAPLWGAGLRFGLAAATFAALVPLLRVPWVRREHRRGAVVYGVFSFGAFYALSYWSLLHVTAGTASVVIGSVPLLTVLLAAGERVERLSARTLLGGALALLGIGWITVTSREIAATPLALLTLVGAALALSQGIIVSKRIAGNHPAAVNAVAMAVGATLLLAASLAAGEAWTLPTQPASVAAVVYLVTLGSMGLFVLTLLLVRHWTASASSYILVVAPLVTIALDALVAGVPLSATTILGAALVLAGTWLGALSRAGAPRAAAAANVAHASQETDAPGARGTEPGH